MRIRRCPRCHAGADRLATYPLDLTIECDDCGYRFRSDGHAALEEPAK